jgi:hypothetical protein
LCYMARPSHPSRLDYSNHTWRRVQIMNLLVMQFPPLSHNLIPPWSKTPSIYVSPLMSQTKFHTLTEPQESV